jgi:hypothetical protein
MMNNDKEKNHKNVPLPGKSEPLKEPARPAKNNPINPKSDEPTK